MTWLECVCGHSLASGGDFAYSSHFFASADWQEAGEQILEAMARLLESDGSSTDTSGEGQDADDTNGAALLACAHCGRRWLRLSDGRHG